MEKKLLILEDNLDCIEIYQDTLKNEYQLFFAKNIKELNEFLGRSNKFNGLIADMRLPDSVFLDWIINTKSSVMEEIPTIIVSSIDDSNTLKNAFEWGASDYLVKPFSPREMQFKIGRLLYNQSMLNDTNHDNEDNFLERLTLIESKIYQYLSQNKNKIVTRENITSNVWKKVKVHPKTLDVHLSNIRKKLASSKWRIETIADSTWCLKQS